MKIKFLITPEWLLEWFWSLVKLHAFQWPHKLIACQTDSSNTKSGKLQKLGGGQKIFIFRGDCPMRGRSENFHLCLGRGHCPIRGGGWFSRGRLITLCTLCWTSGGQLGSAHATTPSGWMQDDVFENWFKDFYPVHSIKPETSLVHISWSWESFNIYHSHVGNRK